jgi:hypothetical protein
VTDYDMAGATAFPDAVQTAAWLRGDAIVYGRVLARLGTFDQGDLLHVAIDVDSLTRYGQPIHASRDIVGCDNDCYPGTACSHRAWRLHPICGQHGRHLRLLDDDTIELFRTTAPFFGARSHRRDVLTDDDLAEMICWACRQALPRLAIEPLCPHGRFHGPCRNCRDADLAAYAVRQQTLKSAGAQIDGLAGTARRLGELQAAGADGAIATLVAGLTAQGYTTSDIAQHCAVGTTTLNAVLARHAPPAAGTGGR